MLKSLRAILVHLHAYTGLSEMYFGFLKFNNKKLISCIFGTGNVLCIQKLSRIFIPLMSYGYSMSYFMTSSKSSRSMK